MRGGRRNGSVAHAEADPIGARRPTPGLRRHRHPISDCLPGLVDHAACRLQHRHGYQRRRGSHGVPHTTAASDCRDRIPRASDLDRDPSGRRRVLDASRCPLSRSPLPVRDGHLPRGERCCSLHCRRHRRNHRRCDHRLAVLPHSSRLRDGSRGLRDLRGRAATPVAVRRSLNPVRVHSRMSGLDRSVRALWFGAGCDRRRLGDRHHAWRRHPCGPVRGVRLATCALGRRSRRSVSHVTATPNITGRRSTPPIGTADLASTRRRRSSRTDRRDATSLRGEIPECDHAHRGDPSRRRPRR